MCIWYIITDNLKKKEKYSVITAEQDIGYASSFLQVFFSELFLQHEPGILSSL